MRRNRQEGKEDEECEETGRKLRRKKMERIGWERREKW